VRTTQPRVRLREKAGRERDQEREERDRQRDALRLSEVSAELPRREGRALSRRGRRRPGLRGGAGRTSGPMTYPVAISPVSLAMAPESSSRGTQSASTERATCARVGEFVPRFRV